MHCYYLRNTVRAAVTGFCIILHCNWLRNMLFLRTCFFNTLKNILTRFVYTLTELAALNHMILHFLCFLSTILLVVDDVLFEYIFSKHHCMVVLLFQIFLYYTEILMTFFAWNWAIPVLWLTDGLNYIKITDWLSGFVYVFWVFLYKLNVTSRKSRQWWFWVNNLWRF